MYDKLRHCQCQVSDLVLGNSYFFRVRACNEVGASEAVVTKEKAEIIKESESIERIKVPNFNKVLVPFIVLRIPIRFL